MPKEQCEAVADPALLSSVHNNTREINDDEVFRHEGSEQ